MAEHCRNASKNEKSDAEFKEHERIIMQKRIAEINHVITGKCHTIWNQFLAPRKPDALQFNFVYPGLDNYLQKCDEYRADEHKDNKQKWWNNQKASEMSQEFLPLVLHSTDHMAKYLGEQIRCELQLGFTNYVMFELLETAITAVFSTLRSGSNEVFLRTSFQYAKSGLRRKLMSYFGEIEIRQYDTKARRKKELWQKLIKKKKERLLFFFQNKKRVLEQPTSQSGLDTKFAPGSADDDDDQKADPATLVENRSPQPELQSLPVPLSQQSVLSLPQLSLFEAHGRDTQQPQVMNSAPASYQFPIMPSFSNYNSVPQPAPQSQSQHTMNLAMLSGGDDRNDAAHNSYHFNSVGRIQFPPASLNIMLAYPENDRAAAVSAANTECLQCRLYQRQVQHLLEINRRLQADLFAARKQQQEEIDRNWYQSMLEPIPAPAGYISNIGQELPPLSPQRNMSGATHTKQEPHIFNARNDDDNDGGNEQHMMMSLNSSVRNDDGDVLLSPSDAESQQEAIPLEDLRTPFDDAGMNRSSFPAHTAGENVAGATDDNVCSKISQTTDGSRSEMSSFLFSHAVQQLQTVPFVIPPELVYSDSTSKSRNAFLEYQTNTAAPQMDEAIMTTSI